MSYAKFDTDYSFITFKVLRRYFRLIHKKRAFK